MKYFLLTLINRYTPAYIGTSSNRECSWVRFGLLRSQDRFSGSSVPWQSPPLRSSTGGLRQQDGGQSSTLAGSKGAETDDAVSGACSLNYEHVSEG